MRVSVTDRLDIADRRVTADGYLAVRANIARSGVYQYSRGEIGLDGNPNEMVGVYRSPEFTFDEASLASFAHRPVTLNHPSDGVSAKSWKRDSVGHIGGAVWQSDDKKHVVVDMLLMDEAGINAANTTHKELSAGYSCTVEAEDGVSPDGEPYAAVMTGTYKANHVALVPAGRAGHTCRVGDAAWPVIEDSPVTTKKETKVPHILHDGLKVDLSDAEAVQALVSKLTADKAASDERAAKAVEAKDAAEAKSATEATSHVTAIEAKDAEVATLTAQVATLTAQLADAQSPERLKDAAAAYAKVVDAATKLGVKVDDGAKEADIRKAVVSDKLGAVAKDWTDAQIAVSFDTLAASIKDEAPVDTYRQNMSDRKVVDFSDAAAKAAEARNKMIEGLKAPISSEK